MPKAELATLLAVTNDLTVLTPYSPLQSPFVYLLSLILRPPLLAEPLPSHFGNAPYCRCQLAFKEQAPDVGTKRSINPFCVVLVDGVEVGRTHTIFDSSDPLWAATFHLSDKLLSRPTSTLNSTGVGRSSGKSRKLAKKKHWSSQSPSGTISSSIDFEVWDRVSHGQPVLVGAAKFPADLLRALLTIDCTLPDNPLGDDSSVTAKSWRGVRQYSLELRLRPREYRQKGFAEGGGNSATAAGLEEKTRGVLSVSVEQVKAATEATGEVVETTAGTNEGNVAGGGVADSGRSSKAESIMGGTTVLKVN